MFVERRAGQSCSNSLGLFPKIKLENLKDASFLTIIIPSRTTLSDLNTSHYQFTWRINPRKFISYLLYVTVVKVTGSEVKTVTALTICVILGQLLNLSEPQFFMCKIWIIMVHILQDIVGIK